MTALAAAPTIAAPEALLRAAREHSGVDRLDKAAHEPLAVLVNSFNREGQLHAAGAAALQTRLVRILANRLRMQRDFAAHPAIAAEPIVAPIFICGMARTGSTKTQKLLAASGDFNWLPYWQVLNPSLISGERGESPQARIDDVEAFVRWFDVMSPDAQAGHAFRTHEPEEESFILEHSLTTPTFMGWAPIDGYLNWIFTQDMTRQFVHLRDTLKYLQWQGLASGTRRWVLKSPLYSGLEPLLLSVFPDATLVMTHRHPVETMPSGLRLLGCFYQPFSTAQPQAASYVAGQAGAIEAHMGIRASLPANRFLDIEFNALMRDSLAAIERVYQHAGLQFSAQARARIEASIASNPQHKFGRHEYSLQRFGLTDADIGRQFAGYIRFLVQRFGA